MPRTITSFCRSLFAVTCSLFLPVSVPAERIMDQMGMIDEGRYAAGHGNHTGGILLFGKNYSLQLCDVFNATATGFVITEIEVGNLTFGVAQPAAAWVSIYEVASEGEGGGGCFEGNSPVRHSSPITYQTTLKKFIKANATLVVG